MWHRFVKSKIGVAGLILFALILLLCLFAEFFAPYGQAEMTADQYKPPQKVHIFDEEGNLHAPFVYKMTSSFDFDTGLTVWEEDTSTRYPIKFFVKGSEYRIFGIRFDRHFFGAPGTDFALFGTNSSGQDVFSRILYGGRVSLMIAGITTIITLILGAVIGMLSGYFKGIVDLVLQRIIELFVIVPSIPLALAMAAFLPSDTNANILILCISAVLAFSTWGNIARQVRGKTLSIRESVHVRAAISLGASTPRILFRHILPSLYNHLIVLATLTVPTTIIAESGLSYLGFGVRSPYTSWGKLLGEAQKFSEISLNPWILIPGIAIIVVVISLNFIGDALRDAVDPYMR